MLDDWLSWRGFENGGVSKGDLQVAARMKQKLVDQSIRQLEKQQRGLRREAQNSLRYLKRSSNQLVKSVKALGRP
jgi:hypothetical protein